MDKADSAINTVSKIPVVGGLAEPVLGIAREGVNVGRSALGVVDTANAGMSAAERSSQLPTTTWKRQRSFTCTHGNGTSPVSVSQPQLRALHGTSGVKKYRPLRQGTSQADYRRRTIAE